MPPEFRHYVMPVKYKIPKVEAAEIDASSLHVLLLYKKVLASKRSMSETNKRRADLPDYRQAQQPGILPASQFSAF